MARQCCSVPCHTCDSDAINADLRGIWSDMGEGGIWNSVSVVSHAAVTCRGVLGSLWQEGKLALTLHIQEGRGHGGACPGVGVTSILPTITPPHWKEAEFTVRQ